MNEKKPFDTLFDADDQTVRRIAAQCEPDWDENRLFEQSYRKYKAQKNGKIVRTPRRPYRDPLRGLVTAACLMVALGGAGSIWFFRYGVEKPQMTVDVETAPTDPAQTTETTAPETAALSTAKPYTTAKPQTVPAVWETAASLHTSTAAASTAAAQSTAAPAVTAVPQTGTSVMPAVTTVYTVVVPQQSTGATVRQETQTTPVRTEPQTTSPGTDAPTEPTETESSEPTAPTDPAAPPSDGTAADNGTFTVQEQNGWVTIKSQDDAGTNIQNIRLTLGTDGYTVEEKNSADYASRLYSVHDPVTGESWDIRQFAHNGFSFSYRDDTSDVLHLTVNGHPAYLIWTKTEDTQNPPVHKDMYSLFWDDGTDICLMQDMDIGGETMLRIAAAVTTSLQEEESS